MIGLIFGFIVGLWIGIGAKLYPPPTSKAPVTTMGCTTAMATNATITTPTDGTIAMMVASNMTT